MSDRTAPLDVWESGDVDAWRREWRLPSLVVLEETGSSNDVLREMADAGTPAGTVVIAESQTAGRGQAGRTWVSTPRASLLFSVLLRSDGARNHPSDPSPTPIRVGLALCHAIAEVAGVEAQIKWPNDILSRGGKVAGILCEGASGATGVFVVAGIGINVNQAPSDLPSDLRWPAASLRSLCGREVPRAALLEAILDGLRPFVLRGPLDSATLDEFRTRDALLGRSVADDAGPIGIARGIDPSGALLVQSADGLRTIRSGSVRIATPEGTALP